MTTLRCLSEKHYEVILRSIGDAVVATDAQGRIELMNPVAEVLTGWRQEEARGLPLDDVFRIVDEDTRRTVESPVLRVMREGQVVGLADHTLLVARDGTEWPVADSAAAIRDDSGATTGVVLVFRDRTRERAAQRALEESDRKFRDTVRYLDEGYWSVTVEGLIIDHNLAFNRLLGLNAAQDMKGSRLSDFWQNPDDRAAYLNELMTKGSIRSYLINMKTVSGRALVVLANAHLVKDGTGKIVRIDGTFTDFTERKQIEEALNRSARELAARNRIAQILLTVPDAEMYAEVLAVILEITGSSHGVFGYLDEKGDLVVPSMTGAVWDKCQAPDKRQVFPRASWGDSSWPTAIREKRTILHSEPSTRTPEGHIQISRHISVPLVHQGRVVGLIQVASNERDYTAGDIAVLEAMGSVIAPVLEARLARKCQEDRLQEALRDLLRSNKELEQFAYVASHDLQEPLRMVSSYTQLLARRYGDRLDQDAMEFIGFAVDGANRMQQLIQDLLVYSRVTTRGSPFVPLDLCDALGEAVANLQAAINESAAMVTHGELPTVNADRRQMVQLFQNLVGNSIKFRKKDEPARVHVSAERANSEWIVSVKDNGIGIDPEYFDRIFVIFQRLHGKKEYPGTGIGLALCRQIVTRHGGRIWVESSPGEGATFHFTIKA